MQPPELEPLTPPEAPAVEVTVIEAPEAEAPAADVGEIALALATGAAMEQAQDAEETAEEAVERVELVEGTLEWLANEVFNLRSEVTEGFAKIAGLSSPTSLEASNSPALSLEEASASAAATVMIAENTAELALEVAAEAAEPTTSIPQSISTDPLETGTEAIAVSELPAVESAEEPPVGPSRRVLKV